MTGDGYRARGRPDEADEHAQGRGFPGPVGAEEAVDLATPHAHVNGVDGEDSAAISLCETVGLDDRGVFHDDQARLRRPPRRQPRDRSFKSSSRRISIWTKPGSLSEAASASSDPGTSRAGPAPCRRDRMRYWRLG